MDNLAQAIGYIVLIAGAVFVASRIVQAAPNWWRDVGAYGALATVLGLGGFVWFGYIAAHRGGSRAWIFCLG